MVRGRRTLDIRKQRKAKILSKTMNPYQIAKELNINFHTAKKYAEMEEEEMEKREKEREKTSHFFKEDRDNRIKVTLKQYGYYRFKIGKELIEDVMKRAEVNEKDAKIIIKRAYGLRPGAIQKTVDRLIESELAKKRIEERRKQRAEK